MAYDNSINWKELNKIPEKKFTNHMIKATNKAIARYGLEEIHKISKYDANGYADKRKT